YRGDPPGRTHPGRGQAASDAAARSQGTQPAAAAAARRTAAGPGRSAPAPVRGRPAADLRLRYHPGAHRHRRTAARTGLAGHRLQGPAYLPELAGRDLRQPGAQRRTPMNLYAVRAIYLFELARACRTLMQSLATPVITTSLYFVVFGAAIGPNMAQVQGVGYGAFIVPGLIML